MITDELYIRIGKLQASLAALVEKYNHCHNPPGTSGGRFCSAKDIEAAGSFMPFKPKAPQAAAATKPATVKPATIKPGTPAAATAKPATPAGGGQPSPFALRPDTPPTPTPLKAESKFTTVEKPLEDKVTATKPLGEIGAHQGVSETYVIELANGNKAIWKPAAGEPMTQFRKDITPGKAAEREVGAWEVAKVVGMDDVVCPAVLRMVNGDRGAALAFQPGKPAFQAATSVQFDGEKNAARAAVFDYVIGNRDRHGGNWMIKPDGNLVLIDHGLAFPNKKGGHDVNAEMVKYMARKEARGDTPYKVQDFAAAYVNHIPEISAGLKKVGVPAAAIRLVEDRIAKLSTATSWKALRKPNPNAFFF